MRVLFPSGSLDRQDLVARFVFGGPVDRQAYRDNRPFAHRALDCHRALMQRHQALDQRQAETRSLELARMVVVHLREGLADAGQALLAMPMPVSLTQKCRREPIRFAPIMTRPPSGVNFTAFETRLINICCTARLSA